MAFMERFHTIRIDRNGVMELIRVPHPANGDDAANEPILPYGLVKVELPDDDVMQSEVGHSEMTSRFNTDEGERNPSSQNDGSTPPLLPVVKVEHPNERVLPEILGTIVEVASSVNGRDERSIAETGDNSPRQVAISGLNNAPLFGGQTTIENTFYAKSTRRDASGERPISLKVKDICTDTTHSVKVNKSNIKVPANYASEADAMASLYPPQGCRAVHNQGVPPDHDILQCSNLEQLAESRNEATVQSLGSGSTNNAFVLPIGEQIIPQRNDASTGITVLPSGAQSNAQVGGRGDGMTIIPNDGCRSQQVLLAENHGEYEEQPDKHTPAGANGCVQPRLSHRIIRLKDISNSSTVTSNELSAVGWPRLPSAVYQTAKLVQPMSATVARTPALTIAHPVSHAQANATVAVPPRQYFARMKYANDKMQMAAKIASMKVMASKSPPRLGRSRKSTKTHQLPGGTRPLLPAPHKQSSTSTTEVVPSAYLVYPNGKVTPLFEVPSNRLNVATNPPLGIRPLRNVGGKHIPEKRPQLSASPTDEMQPLRLPNIFPNPLPLIQGPLSPDLPEMNGTITSTTSPTKRKQRKPSAALPMRSAAKTGPIKRSSASNPGFARRLTSRSARIEDAEQIELDEAGNILKKAAKTFRSTGKNAKYSISCTTVGMAARKLNITSSLSLKNNLHAFPKVNLGDVNCRIPCRKPSTHRSPVKSSMNDALPLGDGASTTETSRPTPSIACASVYECWRSRAAHIAHTLTRQLNGSNPRHLPTEKGWGANRNEGHMAFVPDASSYRRVVPKVFRRPVPQVYDSCAVSEPRKWRNLNSNSDSDETTCPWYNDFYIPGGPGCNWGFRPITGAALFPRVRQQKTTAAPPRCFRQPSGERSNSQEHHENIVSHRPRSSRNDAPANDDPTLQVSGIDYGSIKRRRDTNDGQYVLSKQRRRQVLSTRTVAGRSGKHKRGSPVRKHPAVPQKSSFDIRPCSVVITRLDMDKLMLNECTSGML